MKICLGRECRSSFSSRARRKATVVHGLEGKIGHGIVYISIENSANTLFLRVKGGQVVGMPGASHAALEEFVHGSPVSGDKKRGGIALRNVNSRIRLMFGGLRSFAFRCNGYRYRVLHSMPLTADAETDMKEELIRIEHGYFHSRAGSTSLMFPSHTVECIGVYVDEHLTSGTAYLDIFKGKTVFTDGRAFCCGQRIGATGLERWIRQNAIVVDKSRFASKELTVRDFVLALVRTNHLRQRFPSTERLTSLAATDMLHRMGLNLPWSTRLIDLSMLDYYRLSIFRAWFNGYKLLVLDRLTETLRRQDLAKLMDCVRAARHGSGVPV